MYSLFCSTRKRGSPNSTTSYLFYLFSFLAYNIASTIPITPITNAAMIVPENPYAIADVSAAPSAIALACRTLWIPPKSEEPTLAIRICFKCRVKKASDE